MGIVPVNFGTGAVGSGEDHLPAALLKLQNSVNYLDGSLLNALSNEVTGDGSTSDIAAINALFASSAASNRTVWFPDGTYVCPSAMLAPSGLKVIASPNAKFLRTFRSPGSSGLLAQSSYASKISNVFWQGGKFMSPSNSVDTYAGNMISLYGDNLLFKDNTIDTFGGPTLGGRGFVLNGDHIRVINPYIVNPNAATGNGGIRVTGGDGFICSGGYVESGDDCFQFVPTIAGVLPLNDNNITNGAYIGCTGYSFAARLVIIGVGNQSAEVGTKPTCVASIKDCSFVSIKGIGAGRAGVIQNTDSSGVIARITFSACSFGGALDSDSSAAFYITGWLCSGGINGVDFFGCSIIDPSKIALVIDGRNTQAPLPTIRSYNARNIRWNGGRLEAPSSGAAVCIKITGAKSPLFQGANIAANGVDGVQVGIAGSESKVYNPVFDDVVFEGVANSKYAVKLVNSQAAIVDSCVILSATGATTSGGVSNDATDASYTRVVNTDFTQMAGTAFVTNPLVNGSSVKDCPGYPNNPIVAVTATDQTITSNATLAADPTLVLSLEASATYEVFLEAHWNQGASALGGLQWALAVSNGAGVDFNYTAAPSLTAGRSNESSTIAPVIASALNHRIANAWGVIKTGNNAITLTWQRAQQVSDVNALTIYANSILKATRIA